MYKSTLLRSHPQFVTEFKLTHISSFARSRRFDLGQLAWVIFPQISPKNGSTSHSITNYANHE